MDLFKHTLVVVGLSLATFLTIDIYSSSYVSLGSSIGIYLIGSPTFLGIHVTLYLIFLLFDRWLRSFVISILLTYIISIGINFLMYDIEIFEKSRTKDVVSLMYHPLTAIFLLFLFAFNIIKISVKKGFGN